MEPITLTLDTKKRVDYTKIFSIYSVDIHNPKDAKEKDIEKAIRGLLDAKFTFTDNSELTDVTVEMVRSYRDNYFDKYKEYWLRAGITSEADAEFAHNCYSIWIQRLKEWRWSMQLLRYIRETNYGPKYPISWKPTQPITWKDMFRYMSVIGTEDAVINIIKSTIECEIKIKEKKAKKVFYSAGRGVFDSDLSLQDLLKIERNKIEY